MTGRIKGLPDAGDGTNTKLCQGFHELLQRKFHSLDESVTPVFILRRPNRTFKVIKDREQFLEEALVRKARRVALFSQRQSLVIVELGCQPEVFVL